jgi:hypothetical protein
MKSRHVVSPAGQGSRDFIPAYMLACGTSRDYYHNESWQALEERKDGAAAADTQYV